MANLLQLLADRLDTQPNRPADVFDIQGWARAAGIHPDELALLPDPEGATHSEYAARLRQIAGSV